jgi:hypothetical protein
MYICGLHLFSSPLRVFFFPLPLLLFSKTVHYIHSCLINIIIIIIIVSLGSMNEQEHGIFGLLSLVYLAQHYDLQFHPFSHKITVFFMAE